MILACKAPGLEVSKARDISPSDASCDTSSQRLLLELVEEVAKANIAAGGRFERPKLSSGPLYVVV